MFYSLLDFFFLLPHIFQGERIDSTGAQIHRPSRQPRVLHWHPKLTLLASGWDDGENMNELK
jgi:hypothetical protein